MLKESTALPNAQTKKKGPKGPKDETFRKYKWYAVQLAIHDAINCFEVFYKNTFIQLAEQIQEFIALEKISGNIEAKFIWEAIGISTAPKIYFESQIFHDLTKVDAATDMLVGKRRYNPNSQSNPLKDLVRALQAMYQIRHTLSHNSGIVTNSDYVKLKAHGYKSRVDEVIDLSSDSLGEAILRLIEVESKEFTDWIRTQTVNYLINWSKAQGIVFEKKKIDNLKEIFGGTDQEWQPIPIN